MELRLQQGLRTRYTSVTILLIKFEILTLRSREMVDQIIL